MAGGGGLTSVYLEKEGGAEEFLLCNLRSVFFTTITTFSGVKYLRVGGVQIKTRQNRADSGTLKILVNPTQSTSRWTPCNEFILFDTSSSKETNVNLDLNFGYGEKVCFRTSGQGCVHLSGYLHQG